MSPIQILRMLRARSWLIVLLALIGGVAGAIAAKWMPSRYEARSRIVVDMLKADPVTGETLPPRTLETFLAAQVELVRDPRVTRRVVDHFGWTQSPSLRAAHQRAVSAGEQAGLRDWLAEDVSQRTRATMIRNSPLLEIAYSSTVPETARRGADAVRDAFIAEALDSKRRDAAHKARWFSRQVETLKGRLATAEQRKASFERANTIVLQDDNVDAESSKLRALASSAPAAPAAMAAPAIAPSSTQLAQVDAQLAAARQSMGRNHPDIIALERQRAALSAAVSRELASARAASHASAAVGSAGGDLSAQTRKVLAQRGLVDEARRLAGDVTVLREQVAKTMQRAAEFELQARSTEAGFSRLGAAAVPRAPVTPGRWLLILGGLAAGGVLGVLTAIVLELIRRRVRGPEDLSMAGVPVIGMLPRSSSGWRLPDLLRSRSGGRAIA
ncbi:Wzz/FepE/Etk N-terminal domain-containing protein [Sphingomonas sp. IC-11]|uniref:GumC family protein n=1 Tax=Sphingomonas sp. IC-11 TaxID=2898528 RepID=UPI001E424995|nr:Wzz/FepE/Etk N-terminal domain-containing protein [Sphingomonas sp. IC-11]MCD2316190.1 Wzz/FepE/Etk N-terminal domain-containing protein [Sphingomonas sp. IC-11]